MNDNPFESLDDDSFIDIMKNCIEHGCMHEECPAFYTHEPCFKAVQKELIRRHDRFLDDGK